MKYQNLGYSLNTLFSLDDLTNIINHLPEPLCILMADEQNRPHQFVYANNKAQDLLRISNSDVSKYTLNQLFGVPSDEDIEVIEEKYKDHPIKHDETPLKEHLDGHSLKVNFEKIATDKGLTYFLMMIIDVTEHQETKYQLNSTKNEFESLFEYSPDIIFSTDEFGKITNINAAGLKSTKYKKEEILGKSVLDFVTEESLKKAHSYLQATLSGNVQSFDIQLTSKDDDLLDIEVTTVPIQNDGVVRGFIAVLRNVTERIEIYNKLKESEGMHRALFDYNVDPVIIFDLEGHFLSFNEATERLFGSEKEEILGIPFLPLIEERLQEEAWRNFSRAVAGHAHQYETAITGDDKSTLHLHITFIPAVVNGEVKYIHCICKDITHRKTHDEMMHNMVYKDHLTGLKNQRAFINDLQERINSIQKKAFSVWLIDVDRFKFVNDYLGHENGDHVLQSVAHRLRGIFDHESVYRYGGDAFALLLPKSEDMKIKLLGFQLISQLSIPYDVDGLQTNLTASIGISMFPDHGIGEKELLRAADHALFHAKKNGKNQFQLYNSTIQRFLDNEVKMEMLLFQALENKEFLLHYQPQFDATNGELYGFEALIRWNNPEIGFVSPAEFIPLAEETGVIMQIGEWVIEEVCRQSVEWKQTGYSSYPISINLSLRQFYQTNFIENVSRILTDTGADPSTLVFEITETIAMQENVAQEVLFKLKSLGFKVAMDDFGTGYSSLKYLQTFSIDYLKVDKAFIDKIETREGKAIVATIISLGHHLGMKVVAEGVETAIQVHLLEELNCDFFQGYYFGKPLPVQGIETQHLSPTINPEQNK